MRPAPVALPLLPLALLAGDGRPARADRAPTVLPVSAWLDEAPGEGHAPARPGAAAEALPSDPLFATQWALSAVRATSAWRVTPGSSKVVVAVIDTGVRPHPDLQDRLLPGWDFVSDPSDSGDGDGRDPDPTDPGDLSPSSSGLHGLHVAGLIAAEADNAAGIVGLDQRCRLLPVRALGVRRGGGRDGDIADAIRWAAGLPVHGAPENRTPAHVINLSFSGAGMSRTLQDAVDAARAQGALVVAAAGNEGADVEGRSPGGLAGVLTVGASGQDGAPAAYSNFGRPVALLAPGGDPVADRLRGAFATGLVSTSWLGEPGYAVRAGTSQAAALVSAAAALLLARSPSLGAEGARARLVSTAVPREPGGPGLLDVAAALQAEDRGLPLGAAPLPFTAGCATLPGAPGPAPGAERARLSVAALGVLALLLAHASCYKRAVSAKGERCDASQ